jgi:membrane protein
MKLLMEGIHIIYGDRQRQSFLQRQIRAILLLLLTIAPLLAAAILGVFGKPLRRWVAAELGKSSSVEAMWAFFFHGIAILLAMVAVTVIYRWARPQEKSMRNVLPGAVIATLLWWVADLGFGFYVRKMPYGIVYGGLAAVIGLLIWMELSTIIIFLGAAWNAELAERAERGAGGRVFL